MPSRPTSNTHATKVKWRQGLAHPSVFCHLPILYAPPLLSWYAITRNMHTCLRISKQQVSSSGERYQWGHQLNPHQIKPDILSGSMHHHGNNSAASAVRQQAAHYQAVFQTYSAYSHQCRDNILLPRAITSLTCSVGEMSPYLLFLWFLCDSSHCVDQAGQELVM